MQNLCQSLLKQTLMCLIWHVFPEGFFRFSSFIPPPTNMPVGRLPTQNWLKAWLSMWSCAFMVPCSETTWHWVCIPALCLKASVVNVITLEYNLDQCILKYYFKKENTKSHLHRLSACFFCCCDNSHDPFCQDRE